MKHVDMLEVSLWGRRAGVAFRHPKLQAYAFEYDPAFQKKYPRLSLAPLQAPSRILTDPLLPESTYKKLPSFLSDTLPDEFGHQLMMSWMSRRGFIPESVTPLDRLAYLSTRAMGALEFSPSLNPDNPFPIIEIKNLVEAARSGLSGNLEDSVALKQLLLVGTSAGGQRAKACIAFNPHTLDMHAPSMKLEEGFEHWLIKLDGVSPSDKNGHREWGVSSGFGRVEYAYYLMAKASGITMHPCHLLEEGPRAHFMTKRFDREGDVKVHMQTLCGLAQMDYKQVETHDYTRLFMAAHKLGDEKSLPELFRRMVFNILAKNCDDHTKNFSFCLREGQLSWELSPAYDVCFAHSPHSAWVSRHLMGLNGKFENITLNDMMILAERFQIPSARATIFDIADVVAQWREFAYRAGVPDDLTSSIEGALMQERKIVLPRMPSPSR